MTGIMIPGRLRPRFVVAAGLLVLTTVMASVWTFLALSRLSGIVSDTVRQSESVTAVTSALAGALEREDDAVLLILAGDDRGARVLARDRAVVDKAVADLFGVLEPADERELASPLKAELNAYRHAADGVIALASEREALVEYHQKANPVLRRAVALTTAIRDRHFELAQHAVAGRSGRGCGGAPGRVTDYAGGACDCGSGRMASHAHRRGPRPTSDARRQCPPRRTVL